MPPKRDPKIPELISTGAAGELLGVTKDAARDLYKTGRLAGVGVGRNVLFRRSIVASFAKTYATHKRTTSSEPLSADLEKSAPALSAAQQAALAEVTDGGLLTVADQRVIAGLARRDWVKEVQVKVDGEKRTAWRITKAGREAVAAGSVQQPRSILNAVGELAEPVRDPNIPDLVTATEAAEIMGITRAAVSKRYVDGKLPGADVGHVVVFRRALVDGSENPKQSQRALGTTPSTA